MVSFQGSVPDVMFQYIATKEGLDPEKDFELRYATDPTQAAQLLLSGEVENAVLSEALATAAILQSQRHGDAPSPGAGLRQGLGAGGRRFGPQPHRRHGGYTPA